MNAGRPTKPKELKVLQGTFREDRDNKNAPVAEVLETIPVPPDEVLSPNGEQEWYRVCNELLKMGMLVEIDRTSLLTYCIEYETYLEANKAIKKHGLTITESRGEHGSVTKVNPNLNTRNTAFRNLLAIASHFGFTPASRAKLKAENKPKQEDALSKLLNMDKKE